MRNVGFSKIDGRVSVVDQIINEIKRAILEEKLSPGDKLPPENVLVKMFRVSRGPIREALRALRVAGIIQVNRGNGTYISKKIPLSPMAPLLFSLLLRKGSPVEAFELREMLEIGTLEIIMDKITEDDLEKMHKAIKELETDLNEGVTDSKLLVKHNLDFHYAFVKATHNPLIVELTYAFWEAFSFSIQRSLQESKDIQRAIEDHTAILEAVRAKDVNKGKQAIKKAVRDWEIYGIMGKETLKLK